MTERGEKNQIKFHVKNSFKNIQITLLVLKSHSEDKVDTFYLSIQKSAYTPSDPRINSCSCQKVLKEDPAS